MIKFLAAALSDGTTGTASTKRLVLFLAGFAMSVATVVLAVAAARGHDVSAALWAVTTPLAGIATGSYVGGKFAEAGGPEK